MALPQAPAPLPPASANCQTTAQAAAGGASSQSLSSILRASSGKMRIDAGAISIITDPKAAHAIVLDHINKEARLLPVQPHLPGAQVPGMPQLAGAALALAAPGTPAMKVLDLGKSMIEGHEAEGKQYVIHPPALPKPPQAPGMPGAPQTPKEQLPTTAEVWISSKLGLPVLTKVTGAFGQLTCKCKAAPAAEPSPALFQIPPGYKSIAPPGVAMPKL